MSIQKNSKSKIEKIYPLTPLQAGILAFSKLYGDSMYIVQKKITLEGTLNRDAIVQTLQYLTERYEVLRTFFVTVGVKEPMQAVLRERRLIPEFLDLSGREDAEKEAFIADYMGTVRQKGFDLTKDMLLRMAVVKTAENKYALIWTVHHIILDGWSTGILLSDFIRIYTDVCSGKPVSTTVRNEFSPYVKWLRGKDHKDIGFWREYLSEYNTAVGVEGKTLGSGSFQYQPDEVSFLIEDGLGSQLTALAKKEEVTVNTLFEAVWGLLLQKSNYTDDVVFGYVASGRNIPLAGIENMVGLTINTIPVRVHIEPSDSFSTLVRRMQKQYAQIQQYEYSSLAEIQETTELKNHLINQIIVFENYPFDESMNSDENVRQRGFRIVKVEGNEQTNYDLNVVIIPADRLEVKFMYNSAVFSREELERLTERFRYVLKTVVREPDIACSDISLCFDAEQEKLLKWSVNTECGYPQDVCIHDIFRQRAAEFPDRIAVRLGACDVTYRQLDEQSDRLAVSLQKLGVKRDMLIGLCVEKTAELIIGMLAILKAGGAYVPMDPDYPDDRIRYIVEKSQAEILLTGERDVPADMNVRTVCVRDVQWYNATEAELEQIRSSVNEPQDAAYVIFTSGTTGNPKGVMIPHKNVVRLLFNDRFQFDFSEHDVWTMFHSACFDFSVWEIYGALLYGGKLVLVPKEQAQNSRTFVQLLEQEQVTVLNQVPSSLYNLIRFADQPIRSLRYLVTGGEALTPSKIMQFKKMNPQMKSVNMYGITETTVHTTYKEITEEDAAKEISNIGKPLPTLDTYIMNGDTLCGEGIVGEICVAGEGLAREYVNLPELTAERFVHSKLLNGKRIYRSGDLGRWLPNGEIEYIGRRDEQVKIRGFRIELKEIEEVLLKQDGVTNAVVLVKQNAAQDKQLCAYIVGTCTDFAALKDAISKMLPAYMIPTKYIPIEQIPLTRNGKADKTALRAMDTDTAAEIAQPETATEEKVCAIFAEILQLPQIGAKDDFFIRGGHSLTATILQAKIIQTFGADLPLALIFQEPTVRQIAANIDKLLHTGDAAGTADEIPSAGEKPQYQLSYYQENLWSTVSMGNDNGTLNIVSVFRLRNIQEGAFEKTLQTLFERHEALRTKIVLSEGMPVQIICTAQEMMQAFKVTDAAGEQFDLRAETDLEYSTPFDLAGNPLVRMKLIRTGANEHVFILTLHHIIADAWSFDVLAADMIRFYEAFESGIQPELPEHPLRYVDFAEWQRNDLTGKKKESLRDFWAETLKAPLPVLQMNTDFKRPNIKDVVGEGIDIRFEEAFCEQIKAFAKRSQASVFMVLLAGAYVLLNKYSGQKDIIIGTPIAGREQPQLKETVGYFLNILPLRVNLTDCTTAAQLMDKVRQTTLDAYDHQEYPFSMMLEDANYPRDLTRSPLFDVMVQLIHTSNERVMQMGSAEAEVCQRESVQSKYDLVFNFLQTGHGLELRLEYSTKLFKRETIQRLLKRYQSVIRKMTGQEFETLADISRDDN